MHFCCWLETDTDPKNPAPLVSQVSSSPWLLTRTARSVAHPTRLKSMKKSSKSLTRSSTLYDLGIEKQGTKRFEELADGTAMNKISDFVQRGFVTIDNRQQRAAALGDDGEGRRGLDLQG